MLGKVTEVCSEDRGVYILLTKLCGCSTSSFSSDCLQAAHATKKGACPLAVPIPILAVGKNEFTGGGKDIIWTLVSPLAPPDQNKLLSEVVKD